MGNSKSTNTNYRQKFVENFIAEYELKTTYDMFPITNYHHYLLLFCKDAKQLYFDDTAHYLCFSRYCYNLGVRYSFDFKTKDRSVLNISEYVELIDNPHSVDKMYLFRMMYYLREFFKKNNSNYSKYVSKRETQIIDLQVPCHKTNEIVKEFVNKRIIELQQLIDEYNYNQTDEKIREIKETENTIKLNVKTIQMQQLNAIDMHNLIKETTRLQESVFKHNELIKNCMSSEQSKEKCQKSIDKFNKLLELLFIPQDDETTNNYQLTGEQQNNTYQTINNATIIEPKEKVMENDVVTMYSTNQYSNVNYPEVSPTIINNATTTCSNVNYPKVLSTIINNSNATCSNVNYPEVLPTTINNTITTCSNVSYPEISQTRVNNSNTTYSNIVYPDVPEGLQTTNIYPEIPTAKINYPVAYSV